MEESAPNLIEQAERHRELEEYQKAQGCLDRIIQDDPKNYLAWYEKSKLPIVQEDTVTVKGLNVSVIRYQALPLAEKNFYLERCGFEASDIPEIMERLHVQSLIANERVKYLKMAVRYAPEDVKRDYAVELNGLVTAKAARGRRYKWAAFIIGLVALPISGFVMYALWYFWNTPFFQAPLNVVFTLLISYAISITGMTLYVKAKNNDAVTKAGFITNLLALLLSNFSIISVVILCNIH